MRSNVKGLDEKQAGFTLLELLVVIVAVIILVAVIAIFNR